MVGGWGVSAGQSGPGAACEGGRGVGGVAGGGGGRHLACPGKHPEHRLKGMCALNECLEDEVI